MLLSVVGSLFLPKLSSALHINSREREAHRATASTHSMLEAREFEVKTNLFIQNNESSHVARAQKNNIPIAASGERVHEKCSQHFIMRNIFQMLNFIFLLFFWRVFSLLLLVTTHLGIVQQSHNNIILRRDEDCTKLKFS